IFFRLDVFGQFSGQCFEFVLVHLLTHEGILLKKLLIRGRLHNWIYRLGITPVMVVILAYLIQIRTVAPSYVIRSMM
ncbi:hypothetical protein, partial [Aeromonas salmonicida]|uniref:hypothetical protein n=1 Tax=Aeromonas salmonicida TaxID=645 RepID=UPI001A7E86EB